MPPHVHKHVRILEVLTLKLAAGERTGCGLACLSINLRCYTGAPLAEFSSVSLDVDEVSLRCMPGKPCHMQCGKVRSPPDFKETLCHTTGAHEGRWYSGSDELDKVCAFVAAIGFMRHIALCYTCRGHWAGGFFCES